MRSAKVLSLLLASFGALSLAADGALSSELSENGCFALDGGGYRLVDKDMLGVKGKDGAYRYYIPEEEHPPFATLLYPTNPGKQRENVLELDRQEDAEAVVDTCAGRKADVVDFTKRYRASGNAVDIEVAYETPPGDLRLEYALALPPALYQSARYVMLTAKGRSEGTVGAGLPGGGFKSLVVDLKAGRITFQPAAGDRCQWLLLPAAAGSQDKAYYLVARPTAPKGVLRLKITFGKDA